MVASPVLVGAVTVLIVIVAVFLAYNANQGLPFVPTYNLTAEIPNGSNLVPGNEVRIGGFRVGEVQTMRPKLVVVNGKPLEVALIDMALDKQVQPLAKDSTLIVRARSALGLKYVELTPGTSPATYRPGETIPLKYASLPVEFDDFLNTFDQPTRLNSQADLAGFGDALAGRGAGPQHGDRGVRAVLSVLAAGDGEPLRSEDAAWELLHPARADDRAGRAGRRGPGAAVRPDGLDV